MNSPRQNLDTWLAAARADLAQQAPPAWIESALVARQAERALLQHLRPAPVPHARGARWWPQWRWAVPAAAAAALLVGFALLMLMDGGPADQPGAPSFMALRPLEAIAAETQPIVITSDVPRAQLAALGLPVDPARADLPVRAEFLVSRRGAVLAVRFSPE